MRKIITIIAVIMMSFVGFAEGSGKIQRVLYEHRDYKVVLQMDPSDVGLPIRDPGAGIKAAIMTMKSIALASGWDGWYDGWAVKFPKDPSRDSKTIDKYSERDKVIAAENGKFMDRLFEYIVPEDIAEAQKVLDAGCTCVEIYIYETTSNDETLIGALQMYSYGFWLGAWAR